MSDLAATNCGCGCDDNCSGGMGRSGFGDCSCIIWVLLLLSCCGNGSVFGNNDGCGNDCSCIILILLLLCGCGNGRGFCC